MAERKQHGWTGALVAGGTLVALFWLERRRPLRHAHPVPDRRRVARNVAVAAVTALVVALCERPLVGPATRQVERRRIGLLPRLGLPAAAEQALGVVLLDYGLYWWHILLHRMPFLWRCHLVHHTDRVLDTSTALRFHWLEFLASVPYRLAEVVLGIRPRTLSLWQRLTGLEVLFHHANLRLPARADAWLSRLVVTPRLHGIHHSIDMQEQHTNFSSGLALWDALHRTRKTGVAQDEIEIGVPGYPAPQDIALPRLLALPLLRERGR